MNTRRVFLFTILFTAAFLFIGISQLSAKTIAIPPTHPPMCEVIEGKSHIFIQCRDAGGDINEAFIASATVPLRHTAKLDGYVAEIRVTRPSVTSSGLVTTHSFMWCVIDEQGNEVIGTVWLK